MVKQGIPALACPVVAAMQLLEQKWSLQILRALATGRKRFCQLQEAVGSINSATLSRRLRLMEQECIVAREVVNTIPPWVEYELTEKGQDLNAVIEAVDQWSQKWAAGEPSPETSRLGGATEESQPRGAMLLKSSILEGNR